MAKEKKVFGAEVNEEEKIEEKDGSADITAQTSDELIAELTAEASKKSTSRKKKELKDMEVTRATREDIFSRIGKTIDIPIKMNDNEVKVFTMKRLSEAENSQILDRTLAVKDARQMTEAELEESNKYNYRLLATVIVEPKLTEIEWEYKADTAITNALMEQVLKILTNVDDSVRFEDFQV